jgi:hypothetical protein
MPHLHLNRRQFINKTSLLAASSIVAPSLSAMATGLQPKSRLRVALVGTGIRGNTFLGKACGAKL